MNWWAQVAHVALKDVRMSRWYLAGYAVVVGLAAASGLELVPGTLWPLLVLLLAAICTAVIIQTDSPYRADAFWATRPLPRAVVVTAKFAYIVLVLVGIGVVGQAAALLLGHGVTAAELAGLVGKSALVFGSMLVGAALVAAFTPNLQSYLLVSALVRAGSNTAGRGRAHVPNAEPQARDLGAGPPVHRFACGHPLHEHARTGGRFHRT